MENTYILQYETGINKKDRDIIEKKFRIAKSVYNATLNTCRKRIDNYKKDHKYIELSNKLEKAYKSNDTAKITALERDIDKILNKYNWIDLSSLNDFKKSQSEHFNGALGTALINKIVNKAYEQALLYESGRKSLSYAGDETYFYLEGSNNKQALYFNNGELCFNAKTRLSCKPVRKDYLKYYYEANKDEVKYCRLICKNIRNKKRYFVQLIMNGKSPLTVTPGNKTIYINDIDENRVVVQMDNEKRGLFFNKKKMFRHSKKIELIKKRMDRSLRLSNPDNYYKNGKVKRGKLRWNYSKNYLALRKQVAEIQRKDKESRKMVYEEIINELLIHGSDFIIKKTSFKDASIPSLFIEILNRKLSALETPKTVQYE